MNKSIVTKVLIMSTVLMAGILLIPTNIQDAKANPCSNVQCSATGGNGAQVEVLGLLVMVEMVESKVNRRHGGNGGNTGDAGDGSAGSIGAMYCNSRV